MSYVSSVIPKLLSYEPCKLLDLNPDSCWKFPIAPATEYSENPAWSEKYPEYEYDQVTQQGKYFRKIPISVTDEEYAEILKYANQNNIASINENDNKNKIASVFTGISYAIFIVGAILGFVMGYTKDIVDDTYSFSFAIAIAWWGVSFIGGMFMLGFAEIIKLLHSIKNK